MRVFPCCMGEGEYFAGRGPPFQAGMEAPFVFVTRADFGSYSPYFFARRTGSSPVNGLEPWFLTAAPANYRFDCPRAIFFTLRLAEPRA